MSTKPSWEKKVSQHKGRRDKGCEHLKLYAGNENDTKFELMFTILKDQVARGRVADSRKATTLAANKLNGFAIVRKACRCGT